MKNLIPFLISFLFIESVSASTELFGQKKWWYNSETCDSIFTKTKPNGSGWSKDKLTFTTYYFDSDGDGFGNLATSTVSCHAVSGYVIDNSDCNDGNNTVWRFGSFFIDNDGDGWTSGNAAICYGADIPHGYSITSSGIDCNDLNALLTQPLPYYVDNDNDGGGGNTTTMICNLTPPPGYVTSNCDPDDANPLLTCNNIPNPNLPTLAISITPKIDSLPLGLVYDNTDNKFQVEKTPYAIADFIALGPMVMFFMPSSPEVHWHPRDERGNLGIGLNCRRPEVTYLGKFFCDTSITVIIDGRPALKKYYGVVNQRCCDPVDFPVWPDFLFTADTCNARIFVTNNIAYAYYDSMHTKHYNNAIGDYTIIHNDLLAYHLQIVGYQWGVENNLAFDKSVTTAGWSAATYAKTVTDLSPWVKRVYNCEVYSGDINGGLKWDQAASIPAANYTGYRKYANNDSLDVDYSVCRFHFTTEIDSAVTLFRKTYPGKEMYYVQYEFKKSNPFTGTIGEALCDKELHIYIRSINYYYQSRGMKAPIEQLALMNGNHLFMKVPHQINYSLSPIYYSFASEKGYEGSAYCVAQFPPGFTDIRADGFQRNDSIKVTLVNQSDKTQTISQITVNGGAFIPISISGYYGDLLSGTFSTDNTLNLKPHSFYEVWLKLAPTSGNGEY